MIARALLVAAILVSANSAQALQWPWQIARHHHRHHRHARAPAPVTTPYAEPETDCQEILEARRAVDDMHWQDKLRLLTDGQRANIAKCLRDAKP
jgi:hypothetical protein